jgi:hypothetical protein
MQEQTNIQQDVRLWLLGLLSQEQGQLLEQQLITDAQAFDELSLVEEELIDGYLSGELSERESVAFESYFMNSSERRQQFRVAKAWRSFVEREDPFGRHADAEAENLPAFVKQQPSFLATLNTWKVPLTAALSILVVVVVWIAYRTSVTTGGPSLAVFLEPAIQTREGGALQQINVPRDIQTIELHAKLPKGQSRNYRAVLFDAGGNTILTNENPTIDTSGSEIDVVVVPVPAARLTRGQYRLQLDIPHLDGHLETVASYRFVVATS